MQPSLVPPSPLNGYGYTGAMFPAPVWVGGGGGSSSSSSSSSSSRSSSSSSSSSS